MIKAISQAEKIECSTMNTCTDGAHTWPMYFPLTQSRSDPHDVIQWGTGNARCIILKVWGSLWVVMTAQLPTNHISDMVEESETYRWVLWLYALFLRFCLKRSLCYIEHSEKQGCRLSSTVITKLLYLRRALLFGNRNRVGESHLLTLRQTVFFIEEGKETGFGYRHQQFQSKLQKLQASLVTALLFQTGKHKELLHWALSSVTWLSVFPHAFQGLSVVLASVGHQWCYAVMNKGATGGTPQWASLSNWPSKQPSKHQQISPNVFTYLQNI